MADNFPFELHPSAHRATPIYIYTSISPYSAIHVEKLKEIISSYFNSSFISEVIISFDSITLNYIRKNYAQIVDISKDKPLSTPSDLPFNYFYLIALQITKSKTLSPQTLPKKELCYFLV